MVDEGVRVYPSKKWNLETLHKYIQQDNGTYVIDGVTGHGVVIAILDGRPDERHSSLALQGKWHSKKYNFVGEYVDDSIVPLEGRVVDSDQHGTGVAAVAGGVCFKSCEGIDIPNGIAPYATLLICEVFCNEQLYNVDIALSYLLRLVTVEKVQVDIICMPFAMERVMDERVKHVEDLLSDLARAGVVCVASAGNDGNYQAGPVFPASNHNVISVGALTPGGNSNSDLNPTSGIDVYAHGEKIVLPLVDPTGQCCNNIAVGSGTSYAAPAVAGFLALLLQCVKKHELPKDVMRKYYDIDFLKWLFTDNKLCLCVDRKLLYVSRFLKQLWEDKNRATKLVTEEYYLKPDDQNKLK